MLSPNRRNGQHAQAPSALSDTGPIVKSVLRRVSVALRCEESYHYARVIVRLNAHWRVIACADGIQWILQARRGQRWRNRYFYRTREGLVSGVREYAGDIGGGALVILLRLPKFFSEGAA